MDPHSHWNCCIELNVGGKTVHVFHAGRLELDEFLTEVNRVVPSIAAKIADTNEPVGIGVETLLSERELKLPPGLEKPTFARLQRFMNAIRESLIEHGLSADRVEPGVCI